MFWVIKRTVSMGEKKENSFQYALLSGGMATMVVKGLFKDNRVVVDHVSKDHFIEEDFALFKRPIAKAFV